MSRPQTPPDPSQPRHVRITDERSAPEDASAAERRSGTRERREPRDHRVKAAPSAAPELPWPTSDQGEIAPAVEANGKLEAEPERRRARTDRRAEARDRRGARRARASQPASERVAPARRPRRSGPDATDPEVANRVEPVDKRVAGGRVLKSRVGKMPSRIDRSLYREPSGRRASAGRVLAVGLICFALWTLFDANQLYHNALTSPFGTRRSVAISILRPLAAVTDALGLSGPVNSANNALGRNGPSTSPTLPPRPQPPPSVVRRSANNVNGFGMVPRPHSKTFAPARTVVWPPPLTQPSRAHPLVMLDIGDSIGVDLGFGLGDVFAHDPFVHVLQKGQIDTGLARPDTYNWPAVLEADLHKYHPGAVVIMMGANDNQALLTRGGGGVATGTAAWDRAYRQRVSLLMAEATASGAHVIWVGLPPMQSAAVNSAFAAHVNSIAQQQAASQSGVTYVSCWSTLGDTKGKFVQYKNIGGSVQQIRYSDGVHLAPTGWDLLGSSLLAPMSQAWHINLHASPLLRLG